MDQQFTFLYEIPLSSFFKMLRDTYLFFSILKQSDKNNWSDQYF
ncbi:hypothetical protein pb186bvf_004115 [Paramecium bursaria]